MLRVALTGGIASGKSTVAGMLRELGAYVSQSDEVARDMMRPNQPLFAAILKAFGPDVLTAEAELDRTKIALLAFQQGRLQQLSALVHPPVMASQDCWMQSVGQQNHAAVAVVESAVVLETPFRPVGADPARPWQSFFDRVVTVSAGEQVRQVRYLQRTAEMTATQATVDFKARNAAQWSDARREQHADFVLHNDGSLAQLSAQTTALYMRLRAEAATADAQ